jgi:hypothetical protein
MTMPMDFFGGSQPTAIPQGGVPYPQGLVDQYTTPGQAYAPSAAQVRAQLAAYFASRGTGDAEAQADQAMLAIEQTRTSMGLGPVEDVPAGLEGQITGELAVEGFSPTPGVPSYGVPTPPTTQGTTTAVPTTAVPTTNLLPDYDAQFGAEQTQNLANLPFTAAAYSPVADTTVPTDTLVDGPTDIYGQPLTPTPGVQSVSHRTGGGDLGQFGEQLQNVDELNYHLQGPPLPTLNTTNPYIQPNLFAAPGEIPGMPSVQAFREQELMRRGMGGYQDLYNQQMNMEPGQGSQWGRAMNPFARQYAQSQFNPTVAGYTLRNMMQPTGDMIEDEYPRFTEYMQGRGGGDATSAIDMGQLAGTYFPVGLGEDQTPANLNLNQLQAFDWLMGDEQRDFRQNLVGESVRRSGINPMFRENALRNLNREMADWNVEKWGTGGGAFGQLMRGGFGGWVTPAAPGTSSGQPSYADAAAAYRVPQPAPDSLGAGPSLQNTNQSWVEKMFPSGRRAFGQSA